LANLLSQAEFSKPYAGLPTTAPQPGPDAVPRRRRRPEQSGHSGLFARPKGTLPESRGHVL